MAFKSLIKKKAGFPFIAIIMLIILIAAFLVGGKDLFLKALYRELGGLAFTLILMVILRKVKKSRAKRR